MPADGKIFTIGGLGVMMFKADPAGCNVQAKAKLSIAGCTSPAIVGGKLLVRGGDAVHCYDVSSKAMTQP